MIGFGGRRPHAGCSPHSLVRQAIPYDPLLLSLLRKPAVGEPLRHAGFIDDPHFVKCVCLLIQLEQVIPFDVAVDD